MMDEIQFKKEVKKFVDWLPKDILNDINKRLKEVKPKRKRAKK